MVHVSLNKRAQTSIEFLFLFLIMLIAVNSIIYPRMEQAQKDVMEIHKVGQARLAVKQIANAISEVAAATGESKETTWVFLDNNIKIYCDVANDRIYFDVPIQGPAYTVTEDGVEVGSCNGTTCEGGELIHFPTGSDIELDCSNFHACSKDVDLNCNDDFVDGSYVKKVKVLITKQYALGKVYIMLQALVPS